LSATAIVSDFSAPVSLPREDEVMSVVVEALPVPDETVAIEQLMEFRIESRSGASRAKVNTLEGEHQDAPRDANGSRQADHVWSIERNGRSAGVADG
jgi:hypothetical protein